MAKLRRAYLISLHTKEVFKAVIDEHNFAFYNGSGGWRWVTSGFYKVKVLPAPASDWAGWSWSGRWGANWQDPTWAWVFGQEPRQSIGTMTA